MQHACCFFLCFYKNNIYIIINILDIYINVCYTIGELKEKKINKTRKDIIMKVVFNKKTITVIENENVQYGTTKYTFADEAMVNEIKDFMRICKPSNEQLVKVLSKEAVEITILYYNIK